MGSPNILKLRVLPNLTLQNHPEVNGHCSFIYSKRFNVFILSVLAIFLLCLNSVHAAEIIIQNDHVEYAIDSHGKNLRFLDKASGIDYLDKKIPSYAAGDAFAAGVLAGMHEDWNMSKCLQLGVNVAAASLMDASASESILPWKECLKLGEDFNYNVD